MKHYAYESPFKMKDNEGTKYTLEIFIDELPDCPRTNFSNLCTMICFHRNYALGDYHKFSSAEDFFRELCYEVLGESYQTTKNLNYTNMLQMLTQSEKICIKQLNLYAHSGLSISISNDYPYNDRWDAMPVGFIYITKEKIFQNCMGVTEENWLQYANKLIENETKTYDQYLRGESYGYKLTSTKIKQDKCPHCGKLVKEYEVTEEEDCCWGFYGNCLEENGILENLSNLKFVEEE